MKRVIAGPVAIVVMMGLGSLVGATAHAQATWPMGTRELGYGDLPAPGPDPDSDNPVLTGLSPVITPPPQGGQCFVTCQVNTLGDLREPSDRLKVELKTELFDATGTRRLSPIWTSFESYIYIEGNRDGSATTTNVYSLGGGQGYRFGCTIQVWWQSTDVIGLAGRVSWVCANGRSGRVVLNKAADGSR